MSFFLVQMRLIQVSSLLSKLSPGYLIVLRETLCCFECTKTHNRSSLNVIPRVCQYTECSSIGSGSLFMKLIGSVHAYSKRCKTATFLFLFYRQILVLTGI